MPFKNKEDKIKYQKEYRKLKGKEVDAKRKKVLEDAFNKMTDEEKEAFLQKRRETSLKSYYKNKEKYLERNRKKSWEKRLKYTYGITPEEYYDILNKQNKSCAICGSDGTGKTWTSSRPLVVDHCHESKKIRGLLCDNCNILIGHSKENIQTLEKAIIYLKNEK